MYLAEETHEAIIDADTFKAVQREIAHMKRVQTSGGVSIPLWNSRPFYIRRVRQSREFQFPFGIVDIANLPTLVKALVLLITLSIPLWDSRHGWVSVKGLSFTFQFPFGIVDVCTESIKLICLFRTRFNSPLG